MQFNARTMWFRFGDSTIYELKAYGKVIEQVRILLNRRNIAHRYSKLYSGSAFFVFIENFGADCFQTMYRKKIN